MKIMKEWFYDINKNVFIKDSERASYKVITWEEYEQYRGKYNNPSDELLNAIYNILHISEV